MRIRELLPPAPQLGIQVRPQHVHWQVGKYSERFSIGPGGVGKQQLWVPKQENEQHNLLLDHLFTVLAPAGPYGGFLPQSQRAHVGTGTAAPVATQTGLIGPLANTDFVPSGESDSSTFISNGVYDIRRVKEFAETQVGNQNLAEWGFGGSTTNSLMCRELFRNSAGDPIILTPASDQRLRLIYSYRLSYSPVTPITVAPDIAGLGVRTGQFMLTREKATGIFNYAGIYFSNQGDLILGEMLVRGADLGVVAPIAGGFNTRALLDYNDGILYNYAGSTQPPAGIAFLINVGRSRRFNIEFSSNNFNGTIATIGVHIIPNLANRSGGFPTLRLVFDVGQEIAKNNLHRLVMNNWQITW